MNAERVELLEQLTEAFCNEEAFTTWAALRRGVHQFSFGNQLLIAEQCHQRGIKPSLVQAAWRWKRAGYHPEKGSTAIYIWTFRSRRRKDGVWICCGAGRTVAQCPECGRNDHYFRPGPVFDASQVLAFDGSGRPPVSLPEVPIEGNELLDELAALEEWVASDAGPAKSVAWEEDTGQSYGGFYRHSDGCIHLVQKDSANAVLRVLIHEAAHALGLSSRSSDMSYAEAEVCADAVAWIVCDGLGLPNGSTVPYIAGWGGADAGETLRARAKLIDEAAKTIEKGLAPLVAEEARAA